MPFSVETDCAWDKPIRFNEATKDWLTAKSPWPDPVRQDFNKIAKHNEKFETFCG